MDGEGEGLSGIVSVLYIDPRGVYPDLCSDVWDAERDARGYLGARSVVAHPPCGPWGKMRGLTKHQPSWAAPHALAVVREVGGVLEHPAESRLWEVYGLPAPGTLRSDRFGGVSYECDQVHWGHRCRKRTWLYMVGIPRIFPLARLRVAGGGVATHVITSGPRFDRGTLKVASSEIKRRTPIRFARFLLEMACASRLPKEPPECAIAACRHFSLLATERAICRACWSQIPAPILALHRADHDRIFLAAVRAEAAARLRLMNADLELHALKRELCAPLPPDFPTHALDAALEAILASWRGART